MSAPREVWTVEPGRTLCRDGVPAVQLSIVRDTVTGERGITPADADALAHAIAFALNYVGPQARGAR